MPAFVHRTTGFPLVRIPSGNGGMAVEVCLVAQLPPGTGNQLFADAGHRQRGHPGYIDALDEPSTKLFGIDLARGEATSLYSFTVDHGGHPFHRHAGHRVFTAVAGSGGAQLRFSTIADDALRADPDAFAGSLHCVDVAPDSLFVVRFGGGTWHQFVPLRQGSRHPAFFALSCHTDERGGITDPALLAAIGEDRASIPALTELLPAPAAERLADGRIDPRQGRTTTLSLHAAPDTLPARLCARLRDASGRVRRAIAARRTSPGFIGTDHRHQLDELDAVPHESLLARQFDESHDHDDMFVLTLPAGTVPRGDAGNLLADVLDGFLHNPPTGVSWLMRLRNVLVRPWRLRTSPLGCPVSSLLSEQPDQLFAGRHPVLAQCVPGARYAEVLLGADDRHLQFRSCVGIAIDEDGAARIWLGTRVRCTNLFGRFYMAAITGVHRQYISPAMLRMAVAYVLHARTEATPGPMAMARG
ncbi:DUF2867 domain-containing protein [Luteimonas aestuarii]|uniref:DUF2867 domain-containing protein n=1 Tax=Luteimonas aestuarii TaxID=453837 RepID=A0A4R5TVA2_9GAMM|nr:DUF2867 domain-containing protein [Luteimonas aestuarii]TDK25025.1 DUF2867 domain-containing protein [Luteimonas aestuarii]